MKKVIVSLEKAETITLGRQGEKNCTAVMWNISQWANDFGAGKAVLLYTLDGAENEPYPCQVTMDGSWVRWLITPSELMLANRGKCQLVYLVGNETVAKSPVYMTRVQSSLGEKSSEPPQSFTGWVDGVLQAGAAAEKAAERAEEAVSQLDDIVQLTEQQIAQTVSEAEKTVEKSITQLEDTVYQVTQSGSQAVQAAEETITRLEDTVYRVTQSGSQAVQAAEASITQLENTTQQVTQSGYQVMQATEEMIAQLEDAVCQTALAGSQVVQEVEDAAEEKIGQIREITAQIPTVTDEDNGKIMAVMNGKWTVVSPVVSSWEKIQLIVRAGLAPQYFPVGYEFVTYDSTYDIDIIWAVRGYDTIEAADESLVHTMILETKFVYQNASGSQISFSFDAAEALYYAEDGLEAGTYNFTLLAGYDTNYGGEKTYSFILTQPVPKSGVVMFPWGYNMQAADAKISTYLSQISTEPIETVAVSEGANGTSLGAADGTSPNMNYAHRIRFGSNNYAQSAVRQWLNSAEVAGNVWTPQTVFDRPPAWASSYAGFMAGLPEDFVSVVQTANITCRTNSIFESDSLHGASFTTNQIYSLKDKFFLLSRPEIYGTWDSESYKDGEQLAYYQGLTDVERIKYDASGAARYVWTRSPQTQSGTNVRIIHTSGTLDGYSAFNSYAICPACIIA